MTPPPVAAADPAAASCRRTSQLLYPAPGPRQPPAAQLPARLPRRPVLPRRHPDRTGLPSSPAAAWQSSSAPSPACPGRPMTPPRQAAPEPSRRRDPGRRQTRPVRRDPPRCPRRNLHPGPRLLRGAPPHDPPGTSRSRPAAPQATAPASHRIRSPSRADHGHAHLRPRPDHPADLGNRLIDDHEAIDRLRHPSATTCNPPPATRRPGSN